MIYSLLFIAPLPCGFCDRQQVCRGRRGGRGHRRVWHSGMLMIILRGGGTRQKKILPVHDLATVVLLTSMYGTIVHWYVDPKI
jgi:hypothetical protein